MPRSLGYAVMSIEIKELVIKTTIAAPATMKHDFDKEKADKLKKDIVAHCEERFKELLREQNER